MNNASYSRLVDYYLSLAEQMLAEAFGPKRAMWISRLEQEHTNLQPVFNWLVEQGEAERGLRLAYLLQELWFEAHHTGEARTLLATLLALPEASARTRIRAQCLDLAGAFALSQNDYAEARSLKQEAIAIYQELEDHRERIGVSLPPMFKERFERMIASARQELAEPVQTRVWQEGQTMTLEQATEYALNNSTMRKE